MSFDRPAEAYDRFMGRFSRLLAVGFADRGQLDRGPGAVQRVLDVGCGPGALTAELTRRLGAGQVAAVDPSASFAAAVGERLPDVGVLRADAEHLPFDDATFDRTFAQLVVHFMTDPVAGLVEMARVTRAGGLLAACVWDHGGGRGPLTSFWRAVRDLDPTSRGEADLAGTHEGQLGVLAREAGLSEIDESALTTSLRCRTFEDWWAPFELGVGPAGAHVAGLDDEGRAALRARCAEVMGPAPFTIEATAWCVTGRP